MVAFYNLMFRIPHFHQQRLMARCHTQRGDRRSRFCSTTTVLPIRPERAKEGTAMVTTTGSLLVAVSYTHLTLPTIFSE